MAQSLHSALQGNEKLKIHTLQPVDFFFYWKRDLKKDFLQLFSKGPYQVQLANPCAAEVQGVPLGTCVTPKGGTKP